MPVIDHHLDEMLRLFEKYFPSMNESREQYAWIENPFAVTEFVHCSLNSSVTESLIEVSHDENLKLFYRGHSITQFWSAVKREYAALAGIALNILLPFGSTYLCESTFSALCELKTKKRNRLNVENDLIVSSSTIAPRVENLCSLKTGNLSH